MTSFIEIPLMGFGGLDLPSLYVNTADVITLQSTFDHGTVFEVRDLGTEGMPAKYRTYLPIGMFLDVFGELGRFPGVRSWSEDTKAAYREPAKDRARAAADNERAAAAR